MFRATGSIPQWNPVPLRRAAVHRGDARRHLLSHRLASLVPADRHGDEPRLRRAPRARRASRCTRCCGRCGSGWTGAVVGGLAYELTGIVASLVKPGHDGKLFVSALAPLAFLALLRAMRDRRPGGLRAARAHGRALHAEPALPDDVLPAGGRRALDALPRVLRSGAAARAPLAGRARPRARRGRCSALAVAGDPGAAVPRLHPVLARARPAGRAAGGSTRPASRMPPEEIVTTVLPQFNGVLEHYWGRNFFKLPHRVSRRAVVVLSPRSASATASARGPSAALGVIAVLFLLVAFGGHTPFYRLWYEVMPMMKKVRAPGMAFFLVALPIARLAGLRRRAPARRRGELARARDSARRARRARAARRRRRAAGGGRLLRRAGAGGPGRGERRRAAGRAGSGSSRRRRSAGRCFLAVAAGRLAGGSRPRGARRASSSADLWSMDRLFFEFKRPGRTGCSPTTRSRRGLRQAPLRNRAGCSDVGVYQGSC